MLPSRGGRGGGTGEEARSTSCGAPSPLSLCSSFSSLPAAVSVAGQPTSETHPELLRDKEVQPGITNEEFRSRRRRFADQLATGSVAVLGASPTQYMSGIIPYPYRPNSCFQYLTGIIQPDTLATIDSSGRFVVYAPDESEFRNTWTGALMDTRAAIEVFEADDAYNVSEIKTRLKRSVQDSTALYLDLNASAAHLATAEHWRLALQVVQDLKDEARPVHGLNSIIHRMRWKKSDAEVALMRTSARVAAESMAACMRHTKDAKDAKAISEHDISALFEFECRIRGRSEWRTPRWWRPAPTPRRSTTRETIRSSGPSLASSSWWTPDASTTGTNCE